MSTPKYRQAAGRVRAMIVSGALLPGQSAPSGAALARETGYSVLTCRKALRLLIRDGTLVPGASPGARPRVPARTAAAERGQGEAARALSGALAALRRSAGLTQPQLADIIGMSVTTVGHAETARLWQSRHFWELADKAVRANGELLALHDAYRSAAVPAATVSPGPERAQAPAGVPPPAAPSPPALASVTVAWADGTVTVLYPADTGDNGLARQ